MFNYYVYNDLHQNIAVVQARDINKAYKEALFITGLTSQDISCESA